MPPGKLRRPGPERVTLLARMTRQNDLGETVESWLPGQELMADVQPLGLEDAQRAGLTAGIERLRVFLPPQPVGLPARLRLRERDWQAVHVEPWTSHTVVIVEVIP